MAAVKVGLAQINTTVGNFRANTAKVLAAAAAASRQGVDVLVTPELAIPGYPPEDLLLRSAFVAQQEQALEELCRDLARYPGLHVVVGHVQQRQGALYNAASVLVDGEILATYYKQGLPDYGVFDELRYFSSGVLPVVFEVKGLRFGLAICEDVWLEAVPALYGAQGVQTLLILNASPYTVQKQAQRAAAVRTHAHGLTSIYVNKAGGQDELVFDGASFVMDAAGQETLRLPVFEEALGVVELDAVGRPTRILPEQLLVWPDRLAQIWQALTLAVHDYMGKSGFSKAILGLSGGVDSAVVLALAVDAIGAENVRAVMMPSRYTADISLTDAREMADGLAVHYEEINIAGLAQAYDEALADPFAGLTADVTEENIQARIRGNLLMALSNKFGSLVLTTGNKSELATGYCTLYGDMAGGFAVLKDVPKTWVYELARWRNGCSSVIPMRIIERPPSAELRADQTDQDSLPPYAILDAIIERYVEHNESLATIVQAGFERATVEQVLRLIRISEYKRRQGAIGPTITTRAFGRDWRCPVTNAFHEKADTGE